MHKCLDCGAMLGQMHDPFCPVIASTRHEGHVLYDKDAGEAQDQWQHTEHEETEAKAMAEAVNGGNWDKDYTEVQQRGWILKVRWAMDRYCGTVKHFINDADAPSTSKSYTQTFEAGKTYSVSELERAEKER